jgi:hypothetical protein
VTKEVQSRSHSYEKIINSLEIVKWKLQLHKRTNMFPFSKGKPLIVYHLIPFREEKDNIQQDEPKEQEKLISTPSLRDKIKGKSSK